MGKVIGVISDTHIWDVDRDLIDIYERYLKDTDAVFHAGDYVGMKVVEFFEKMGEFYGVCGNMDDYSIKDYLPEQRVIEIEGFRIGLIHGWGASVGLERKILERFSDVDAIVYGHTHRPFNNIIDGVLMFNPGTAIGYSRSGRHTIGILEIDKGIKGKIIDI